MSKSSKGVINWRKRTKERLVASFGGKCGICGYDKCIAAFDFHHFNPGEKEFSLGSIRGNCRSWNKIVIEVRKCVMLCANCHREVHNDGIEIPLDITKFDEKYSNYTPLTKIIDIDKCPICGLDKKSNRKTCSLKCRGIKNRKVNWNEFDLILKEEIKKKTSWVQIGKIIGISDNAARKRAQKLGLL